MSESGKEIYSDDGKVIKGYLAPKKLMVKLQNGEEVSSDGVLVVDTTAGVVVRDKIKYGTDEYRIISIDRLVDEHGNIDHIEATLQLLQYD